MPFDGKTYDQAKDGKRLLTSLAAVRQSLQIGCEKWWFLYELKDHLLKQYNIRASEAGISARIRDLRKTKFGGFKIETKRFADEALWAYRIEPPYSFELRFSL